MEMTGGEALAAQLVREGVTTVFGVPGVQLDHAMDGLATQGGCLRYVGTRHEQGAAYMADGYARVTGEVGVAMVVPGPGVLNAGAAMVTAYACSSPVLLIAGQIPSAHIGAGLGLLHEIPDQHGLVRSLTKWSAMARTPAEIPVLVRQAMHEAKSGRPRPVALEIPPDVLAARGHVALEDPAAAPPQPAVPDPALLDRAADMLRSAARPVIYAGGGAVSAGPALGALADLVQAPVVMSSHGRGAVSDRHPLALASTGGREVLPDADVVLVVGSRFVTGRGLQTESGGEVILVNADPADLGGVRHAALAIMGDAELATEGLLARLAGLAARPSRRAEMDAVRERCAAEVAAIEPAASWVRALRDAIPDDGVLVTEMTQVGYLSWVAYPVFAPRTFVTAGYQGTLGYGFPTALGAKVALPDRAVVSITGDGGFGWGLSELATARRHGIGLVTVVFADGAFGNVLRTQDAVFGGRRIGSELTNPDFVALAEAFGVRAERVDSPDGLSGALGRALSSRGPSLVEVPVGPMPSPWGLLAELRSQPATAG